MGRFLPGWLLLAALAIAGCRDTSRSVEYFEPDPLPGPAPEEPPVELRPEEPPPPSPDPPLDETPTKGKDGVTNTIPGVYTDKGAAPPDAKIRSLISFPIRDRAGLDAAIRELYDPAGARFRRYFTASEWIAAHAPAERDVQVVREWLVREGFEVQRVATNRLLLHFTGTVGQFNQTFQTEVRIFDRKSPQAGNRPHEVYGFAGRVVVPKFVKERIHAVLTADLPVETGELPPEATLARDACEPGPEIEDGYTPAQIARAYNVDSLFTRGHRGEGVKLGVLIGAHFRYRDARKFWSLMGIQRADPIAIELAEPPVTRYREGTLDVEWAGAMAPEAELRIYIAPDARNTSIIYGFNEAIARNEISVLSTSFAHREDSEPRAVAEAFDQAAAMAAALGITIAAASGDSAGVDVPSSSPYVTAVGGTSLGMIGMRFVWERAWRYGGSGLSTDFPTPWWQQHLRGPNGQRAVVDVALNAGMGYWYCFLGNAYPNIGTSFAAPVFAALVAVVNSARLADGKPQVGWLNSQLYTDDIIQRTFRDITVGYSERTYKGQVFHGYDAGPGWDIPTGWGAPDAEGLYRTLR